MAEKESKILLNQIKQFRKEHNQIFVEWDSLISKAKKSIFIDYCLKKHLNECEFSYCGFFHNNDCVYPEKISELNKIIMIDS